MGRALKTRASIAPIKIGTIYPKQAEFYASRALYTCYGGARGGGKSHAVRVKAISGAVTWPGIKILIIRRTYPDLENSIITPLLTMLPQGISEYNSTVHMIKFLNGSTIKFGHYQGAGSASEYQGQQYDWIFMDEATQFTETEFRILGGCLRGVNKIPKRFYLTCNPGGIGHRWVKRLFIDRDFKQNPLNPEGNENPDDYKFIFATVEDNKALMESSPAYVSMLASLPESMRAAHRYGDWNALSGQFFDDFRADTHVIAPFKIPDEWVRYRAIDYGLDMFACLWIAVDFEGKAYVYRECAVSKLIVSMAAQLMHDLTLPGERISATYAPPDLWSTQKDTGMTMAELFMRCGIGLIRANNSRVQGWLMIKEMLKRGPDGKPTLFISSDCKRLISDLPALQYSEKNPSDCSTEPHEITHICDALRYYSQSRSMKSERAEFIDEDELALEDYDDSMTGGEATGSYLAY